MATKLYRYVYAFGKEALCLCEVTVLRETTKGFWVRQTIKERWMSKSMWYAQETPALALKAFKRRISVDIDNYYQQHENAVARVALLKGKIKIAKEIQRAAAQL